MESASGSVAGGTTIYITGLGFDTNANSNQVFVGNYPCTIPADGATATTLACVTTASWTVLNNIDLTVVSNGVQAVLSRAFSYVNDKTPHIYGVYPASAVADTLVHFRGYHRISNTGDGELFMGDIEALKIGEDQCNTFDVSQPTISPHQIGFLKCLQSS